MSAEEDEVQPPLPSLGNDTMPQGDSVGFDVGESPSPPVSSKSEELDALASLPPAGKAPSRLVTHRQPNARRVPDRVRKSLQEKELRELLIQAKILPADGGEGGETDRPPSGEAAAWEGAAGEAEAALAAMAIKSTEIGTQTLSKNNPVLKLLRASNRALDPKTYEELKTKIENIISADPEPELEDVCSGSAANAQNSEAKDQHYPVPGESATGDIVEEEDNDNEPYPDLHQVVLKFTTVSEGIEMPSFAVSRKGATIGRGPDNTISIPNDPCMKQRKHAVIEYRSSGFYIQDQGHAYGAAIRIAMGAGLRQWPLRLGATFSAGNGVFHVSSFDEEGAMFLEVIAGPLKGERRRIMRDGATVGRATENSISIADRELSRRHSKVEFEGDEDDDPRGDGSMDGSAGSGTTSRLKGTFYLCDVGSTNGTYMQLVGPCPSSRKLRLSDHILVGRTGFSINRFDWGVWEDRGMRRTMEDKSLVIQDLGIGTLTKIGLGALSFMAVYDGHGGGDASAFLWQQLHLNVAAALEAVADELQQALLEETSAQTSASPKSEVQAATPPAPKPQHPAASNDSESQASNQASAEVESTTDSDGLGDAAALPPAPPLGPIDKIMKRVITKCYLDTDQQFLTSSEHPQCGSTATTAFILGDRLYSFNVGDSRTIVCRNGAVFQVSRDHKPSREDEMERIKDAGGLVINKRVMGELAVSRAFGDKEFKMGMKSILNEDTDSSGGCGEGEGSAEESTADKPLITAEPEMFCTAITPQDQFVLLACDGLFDVFSNEEVVDVVLEEMGKHGDAQRTCEVLTERAISERYTRDNVTVVLVILNSNGWTRGNR
ncbi:unnamed protein product [Chrysoparadoxa australica]